MICIRFLFILLCFVFILNNDVFSSRGCCSWHGGISHCDKKSGKFQCNDETLSPSCYCSDANIKKLLKDTFSTKNTKARNTNLLSLDEGLPVELSVPYRSEKKIGGVEYLSESNPSSQSNEAQSKSENREVDLGSIPYDRIAEFVNKIKERLCKVDKSLKYEIWISFGRSVGVFVSSRGETGMKIIIDCFLQK